MRERRIDGPIIIIILLILVMTLLCFRQYIYDQERTTNLNNISSQTEVYYKELNELKNELADLESSNEYVDDTRYLDYGFYCTSIEDIDNTKGAIVLDLDSDSSIVEYALSTGREIVYFYAPNEQIPEKADLLVIRSQNATNNITYDTNYTYSYHVDQLGASVLDSGAVCIPYIYVKDDTTSITNRLNTFKCSMFVIFNVGVSKNLDILDSYTNYSFSTIAKMKEHILDVEEVNNQGNIDNQERINEIETRIEELNNIIDSIYQENN